MISGLSLALLEAHAWWNSCGRPLLAEHSARSLDAFIWIDRLRDDANARRQREAEQQRAFVIRR